LGSLDKLDAQDTTLPGEQATALTRIAIETSLLSMGVDTRGKSPEEIATLLDLSRIMIRELDAFGKQASGFYIFKVNTKLREGDLVDDIIPVWFISDAYIKDLKVTITMLDIEGNHGREISWKDKLIVKH
jgi:hypothetical protein